MKSILVNHQDDLHKLAKALVEYETLSADEVRRVLKGERLERLGGEGVGMEKGEGKVVGSVTSALPA